MVMLTHSSDGSITSAWMKELTTVTGLEEFQNIIHEYAFISLNRSSITVRPNELQSPISIRWVVLWATIFISSFKNFTTLATKNGLPTNISSEIKNRI